MKAQLLIAFFLVSLFSFSQERKIQLIHSDNTIKDEAKYPDAIVALGNVEVEHAGATLQCKQALIYQEKNIIKAFGDVIINQGDTIIQTSKYVHYDGKTKMAKSWGNVVLTDPQMTLRTDTLHFDRTNQLIFYQNHATIKDSTNTLESQIGTYYLETNMFQALSKVIITNLDNVVTSNHLDYYTDTGISNLYGPSTIVGKENKLYCEKGFNDSKKRISHFIENAKLTYKDRIIEGDSLYYDEYRKFASATGNIVVTDTINETYVKGGYAEYFEAKDSVFVIKRPYVITVVEKDSTYIHGDTLLVTGKPDFRIIRAFHHVKFFKKNLQGKCDSLYTNEAKGLTKMYRRPILWSDVNQITGDTIHFTSNTTTQELDSLKVYNNAFVIKKDSTSGFSQIKGKYLYGKFVKDTIDNIYVSGNGEMINYNRDEKEVLVGITEIKCTDMNFVFNKGDLITVSYKTKPEGKTYPPSKFPEDKAKLKGFLWRQEEQPLSKDDIFIHDQGDDALITQIRIQESKKRKQLALDKKVKEEREAKAAAQKSKEEAKGKENEGIINNSQEGGKKTNSINEEDNPSKDLN